VTVARDERDLDERLVDLLYPDELTPEEAESLRRAVEAHPVYAERLRQWQRVQEAAQRMTEPPSPDPQIHYDLLREARAATATRGGRKGGLLAWLETLALSPALAGAAVVTLVAGGVFLLHRGLDESAAPPATIPGEAAKQTAAAPATPTPAAMDEGRMGAAKNEMAEAPASAAPGGSLEGAVGAKGGAAAPSVPAEPEAPKPETATLRRELALDKTVQKEPAFDGKPADAPAAGEDGDQRADKAVAAAAQAKDRAREAEKLDEYRAPEKKKKAAALDDALEPSDVPAPQARGRSAGGKAAADEAPKAAPTTEVNQYPVVQNAQPKEEDLQANRRTPEAQNAPAHEADGLLNAQGEAGANQWAPPPPAAAAPEPAAAPAPAQHAARPAPMRTVPPPASPPPSDLGGASSTRSTTGHGGAGYGQGSVGAGPAGATAGDVTSDAEAADPLAQARSARTGGDFRRAAKLYEAAIKQAPAAERPAVLFEAAQNYEKLGDTRRALDLYRRAVAAGGAYAAQAQDAVDRLQSLQANPPVRKAAAKPAASEPKTSAPASDQPDEVKTME
jgi:hypothetical protein